MKENRDCKIIQDLLPNYIENLTNEETNSFIQEHLRNCNECKEMLDSMKREVNINDEKIEDREVKTIKRFITKFKFFRNALIIILCAYILIVCRRFIIFTDISNKASNFNSNNYYSRIEGIVGKTQGGAVMLQETYHKDEAYLIKRRLLSYPDIIFEEINYRNDKDNEYLSLVSSGTINSEMTKTAGKVSKDTGVIPETTKYSAEMSFIQRIIFSFTMGIHKVRIQEKDCYLINDSGSQCYIDSETGMVIKVTHPSVNTTFDYYYECDGMTDEDVKKPDTTGYKIYN